MAWGLFQGKRMAFLIFTVPVLLLFSYMYCNIASLGGKFRIVKVLIVCVVAGAIGNMIDRIRLSYVVDFLDFNLIRFPVFNVADIYVTVSAGLLILLFFFYYKEEELEQVIPGKKR